MFRLRTSLSRVGRWPRLSAAGGCLLLALVSALGNGATAQPSSHDDARAVVVTTHSLPAGRHLAAHDLTMVSWPARLRPAGAAARVRDLVGRRLAGPLGAHEAVTTSRLLGAGLADGLPSGVGALSVQLADPHDADLVRAGDLVDLLDQPVETDTLDPEQSTRAGSVSTVASRLRVLAVLSGSDDETAELVVAADRATALRIVRAEAERSFTAVLDPS